MDKEKYVEPMVADRDGNIYFSAKYISESKNDLQERIDKAIEILNFRSHSNDIELNMLHNLRMMNKAIEILKGSDE